MKEMKSMQRIISVMAGLLLLAIPGQAFSLDEDPVLLRIEDEEISLSEFKEIYRRNNVESMVAEPKGVDEYLEMYIDFRLKVKAAIELGMDTSSSFIEELRGYRQQLAQQYFTDDALTDQLVREAWERSQYDVRASHILINLDAHAAPGDTAAVYEQMMQLRQRFLDGEDFGDLARQYSDDPSARDRAASGNQPARRGNAGDLGYFSVFNMVYPFESAAFNTEVGEVSMPVRSNFGYHLVKVTDRLPAMGRARVAHIMLMTPSGSTEEELQAKEALIHDLHGQIMDGADFGQLAEEHSEDRQSASRQGEMLPFTSNRMVPQFIQTISGLHEPGQVSAPIQSDFGWHIIKLKEKNPPPSYDEALPELQNRIQRDERSRLSQEAVIERLREEYDFSEDRQALAVFYDLVDESIFRGEWETDTEEDLDQRLAEFGSRQLLQRDFAKYLRDRQRRQNPTEIPSHVHRMYDQFIRDEIMAYEDARLEEKYPEFKRIVKEYHDGILLFEITDQKVWSKAARDTVGLKEFFHDRREQYDADELHEVRGLVIADYQNYLEQKWLADLRKRFEVWVDEESLNNIVIE